jgi:signal transduction histidine kinase
MKIIARNIVLIVISVSSFTAYGQQLSNIDSLKKALHEQKEDTNKTKTLYHLSISYRLYHPDSSLAYAQQALKLAERLHYEVGEFWSMTAICGASILVGNYPLELEYAFKAFSLSKKLNTPRISGFGNGALSDCYYNLGEYDSSLNYWQEVIKIIEQWFPEELYVAWANLSRIYGGMNEPDSAMLYAKKAYEKIKGDQRLNKYWHPKQMSAMYTCLGDAFAGKAGYDSALFYYRTAISLSVNNYWETHLMNGYIGVAAVCKATGKLDSAVWYAKKALAANVAKSYPLSSLKAANLLSDVYDIENRPDSTLKYLRMVVGLRETLFNRERMMSIQSLHHKEQERQKEVAESKSKLRSRFVMYLILVAFIGLLLLTGIVLRNKRQKQLQSMRNSIATDLHDEIGSNLTNISILTTLSKSNLSRPDQANNFLQRISEEVSSSSQALDDIIWSVNTNHDTLEETVARMRRYAAELFDAANIRYDLQLDPAFEEKKLIMEQRRDLYLLYKEAVNNIFKHAEAKQVIIKVALSQRQLMLTIKDDGKGFETGKESTRHGLKGMTERVKKWKGKIDIASSFNQGVCIQIQLPIAI